MDWCSWLSKTGLDSSLINEYGVAFTRNELHLDDAAHFNHEFLQSMGINVAKHRLEILKVAQKEARGNRKSLFKLVWAINKTKKVLTKSVCKWAFPKDPTRIIISELTPYQSQWTGALRKQTGSNWPSEEKVKNKMRSGPLDRKEQDRLMVVTRKCVSVSGPLDGKVQERMMQTNLSPTMCSIPNRSPRKYRPLDGMGLSPKMDGEDRVVPSLWSLMFQDMKPT